MSIKLLLVDDQNLVKMGICSLLQLSGKMDVVAQLEDGTGVLAAIEEHQPDIMLLDIRMPNMDGLEVLAADPFVPDGTSLFTASGGSVPSLKSHPPRDESAPK